MTDEGEVLLLPWRSTVLDFYYALNSRPENHLPKVYKFDASRNERIEVEHSRIVLTNECYSFEKEQSEKIVIHHLDAVNRPESRRLIVASLDDNTKRYELAKRGQDIVTEILMKNDDFWRRPGLLENADILLNQLESEHRSRTSDTLIEHIVIDSSFVEDYIGKYKENYKQIYRDAYPDHKRRKNELYKEYIKKMRSTVLPTKARLKSKFPRLNRIRDDETIYQSLCCCPIPGDAILVSAYRVHGEPIRLLHRNDCEFTDLIADIIERTGTSGITWQELEILDKLKLGIEIVVLDVIGTANQVTEVLKNHEMNIADLFTPPFYHLFDGVENDPNVHIEDLGLDLHNTTINSGEILNQLQQEIAKSDNFIHMERMMYPGEYRLIWNSANAK